MRTRLDVPYRIFFCFFLATIEVVRLLRYYFLPLVRIELVSGLKGAKLLVSD
jgi:hypothetical protein